MRKIGAGILMFFQLVIVHGQGTCFEITELNAVDTVEEIKGTHTHQFVIKSISDTLEILTIRGTGLQAISWRRRGRILPGESDTILVHSPLRARPGPWHKRLTVQTDKCVGNFYTIFYVKAITPAQQLASDFESMERSIGPHQCYTLLNDEQNKGATVCYKETRKGTQQPANLSPKNLSKSRRSLLVARQRAYVQKVEEKEKEIRRQYKKEFYAKGLCHAELMENKNLFDVYSDDSGNVIAVVSGGERYARSLLLEHFYFCKGELVCIKKSVSETEPYSPYFEELPVQNWWCGYFYKGQILSAEETIFIKEGKKIVTTFPGESSEEWTRLGNTVFKTASYLLGKK